MVMAISNTEAARNYRIRLYLRALAAVMSSDDGKCQHCGERQATQFAHRYPTNLSGQGRGQHRRWYDVATHPSHYMHTCRECNDLVYRGP